MDILIILTGMDTAADIIIRTTATTGHPFLSGRHSIGITGTAFIISTDTIAIIGIGTEPKLGSGFWTGGCKIPPVYFFGDPDVIGAALGPVSADCS